MNERTVCRSLNLRWSFYIFVIAIITLIQHATTTQLTHQRNVARNILEARGPGRSGNLDALDEDSIAPDVNPISISEPDIDLDSAPAPVAAPANITASPASSPTPNTEPEGETESNQQADTESVPEAEEISIPSPTPTSSAPSSLSPTVIQEDNESEPVQEIEAPVEEIEDFPVIQDVGQGYYPCHPEKGIINVEATCTRVELPPQLCQRCPLRPVTQDGQFHLCNNIFDTDTDSCKEAMVEYVQLNGECDPKRADAVREWLNGDSFAKQVVDYFLYSVCELCCDCIPMGVQLEDYKPLKDTHSLESPTLWDAERGNCPAHATYDLCRVLPNVEYLTSPGGPSQNLPPACPSLESWISSGRSSSWETDPDTSIDANTKVFLDSALDALQCDHANIWNKCYIMEDLQNHIDLPGSDATTDAVESRPDVPNELVQEESLDNTDSSDSASSDVSEAPAESGVTSGDNTDVSNAESPIENGSVPTVPVENVSSSSTETENEPVSETVVPSVPVESVSSSSTETENVSISEPNSEGAATNPATISSPADPPVESSLDGNPVIENSDTNTITVPVPESAVYGSNKPASTMKSSSGNSCFPGNANVELENGSFISMKDLQIGDRVRVTNSAFSDVYMFSHKDPYGSDLHYVRLNTQDSSITLTPGHFIYVQTKESSGVSHLIPAKDVKVGDHLQITDGSWKGVKSVKLVQEVGLFNPHTVEGSIIVNGIRTSTFTTSVKSGTATALLAPIRALYYLGLVKDKNIGAFGANGWEYAIPTSMKPNFQ